MPDLKTFKRWVSADWKAQAGWRARARDDFRFVAGDQWSEEEKQALTDMNRVPIVFNRTATIINAVVGSEINNRTEVRYMPRTLGDAEVNDLLSKGAEWYRDQASAEEEDSQAFNDAVVCGLGWTESLLDFEEDPEGQPVMERMNPLEMCWDSSSERRGLTDAKRMARVREIGLDDAKEMFPDAKESELSADWLDLDKDPDESDPHQQWSDDDYSHDDDDEVDHKEPKPVVLVQLQYKQRRRDVEYVDPLTGGRQTMGKRQFERTMSSLRDSGVEPQIEYREITRYEWKQVFLGKEILEENQPCADCPTFCPITAYWDNAKREWYGLLRQIRDPQKFANKWLSQTLHIINSNSKGGVFAEVGATDDPRKFEEDYSAADSVIWMRDGALSGGKVAPKPATQMPAALMSLTEFAIASIRDVSGVNQELLGLRDQNQPGILEYQRKQAAMTTLAVLFDALRQYRKQQGKILLFYMVNYLADGRLIRISDEKGARYERLTIDPQVQKYDVIVDDAPTSPNNKERVWEVIMHLMPVLQQAGLPPEVWAEIIEYSPFPPALVEKLREFAQQPQGDPMAEQAAALQLQKLQAEIEEKRAETEREKANAFENMAQGQLALAKAQLEPVQTMSKLAAANRPRPVNQPRGGT